MRYKVLGFAVWQGARWYLRRRYSGAGRKAAIAALAGGVIVGGAPWPGPLAQPTDPSAGA
jgi:hypothetical protein